MLKIKSTIFVYIYIQNHIRGIPDYDHQYGLIRFDRSVKPKKTDSSTSADPLNPDSAAAGPSDDFQTFQGQGFSLKKGRK